MLAIYAGTVGNSVFKNGDTNLPAGTTCSLKTQGENNYVVNCLFDGNVGIGLMAETATTISGSTFNNSIKLQKKFRCG